MYSSKGRYRATTKTFKPSPAVAAPPIEAVAFVEPGMGRLVEIHCSEIATSLSCSLRQWNISK